jgi:hypothetical protein
MKRPSIVEYPVLFIRSFAVVSTHFLIQLILFLTRSFLVLDGMRRIRSTYVDRNQVVVVPPSY